MFFVFIHVRDCEYADKRTHYRYDKDHDKGEVVGKKQGKGLAVIDHEEFKIIERYNLEDDEDLGEEVPVFEPVI